jgi:hypothetical protein
MANSDNATLTCSDCGREIVGPPVVLSADEHLCSDCWSFFLSPIPAEEMSTPAAPSQKPSAQTSR